MVPYISSVANFKSDQNLKSADILTKDRQFLGKLAWLNRIRHRPLNASQKHRLPAIYALPKLSPGIKPQLVRKPSREIDHDRQDWDAVEDAHYDMSKVAPLSHQLRERVQATIDETVATMNAAHHQAVNNRGENIQENLAEEIGAARDASTSP